jgi:hypothetical protein
MKTKKIVWLFLLCLTQVSFGQDQSGILKTILATYYKNEKPVVKGRGAQFLFVFCEKANNNEEMFETINSLKLSKQESAMLKSRVNTDKAAQNWSAELAKILTAENAMLKSKVNECMGLEAFQEKQKKSQFNNQRLLIISKPVFYTNGKTALVKVVFYRSIEHNSGSVLLMTKKGDTWEITSMLNPWET